jgi:hypothetical protein
MVDISITAANVLPGTNARRVTGTAGATITQGKAVYLDTTDNKYKLADANASAATAAAAGIALTSGADGQPIDVQYGGRITIGGTAVAGTTYIVSGTAGGVAPDADGASGWYKTVLGVGISATQIEMPQAGPFVSGVAI